MYVKQGKGWRMSCDVGTRRKGWRMSCDVGEVTEMLENEWRMSSAHSPSFPSLHLHHSSLSNPSLVLSTSQLIVQPFRCFTYVTAHSPTLLLLFLRHRIFTYVTWRATHGINKQRRRKRRRKRKRRRRRKRRRKEEGAVPCFVCER